MTDITNHLNAAGGSHAGYVVAKALCRDAHYAVTLESMRGHAAQIHAWIWLEDEAYGDPKAFLDAFFKELRNQLNDLNSAMGTKEKT
jgi:hypothetical protein